MRKFRLIIYFSLFVLSIADGLAEVFPVHKRPAPDMAIEVIDTRIPELQHRKFFETDWIKIVEKTGDNAISVNIQDRALLEKAATVFYHANKARQFFLSNFGPESLNHLKKLVIRLNITRSFNDVAHFGGAHLNPDFNNALTIPPSGGARLSHYEPWGHEIWFRPGKLVKGDAGFTRIGETFEQTGFTRLFASNALKAGFSAYASETAIEGGIENLSHSHHLQTMAVGFGMAFLLPKALKVAGKYIKQDYFLETALVPEIIYHEFVHAVLAKEISPRNSTPVGEGLANFFASQIARTSQIAHKAGDRQRGYSGRDGESDPFYSLELEARALAQHNFCFQLLWHSNKVLGETGKRIIYRASHNLNSTQDIKYGLIDALFLSVDEIAPESHKTLLKLRLNKFLNDAGL